MSRLTDREVVARALVHAPYLKNVEHPGHMNMLASWLRERADDEALPAWPRFLERVCACYHDFIAMADFWREPPCWHYVGWNAGGMLANCFDATVCQPFSISYLRNARSWPAFDEVTLSGRNHGLLSLPVRHGDSDAATTAIGIFSLTPDTAPLPPFLGEMPH